MYEKEKAVMLDLLQNHLLQIYNACMATSGHLDLYNFKSINGNGAM